MQSVEGERPDPDRGIETHVDEKLTTLGGMGDFNPLIPRDVSPWSTREKVFRMIWAMVQATLFRCSFHDWYRWRSLILKQFGAKLGSNVRIRRTVKIEIPSNLKLGDDVIIGDSAILYALGPITIGDRVMISQYAHLCAGSHDYRFNSYPLTRPPITIGNDCWVAAGAFIGPGVTLGDRCIVGAQSAVFTDVAASLIVGGNPAKVLKERGPDESLRAAPLIPTRPAETAIAG